MYAVIKTGGKQHKVKPGDIIEVEYLKDDGKAVTFHPVLVVDDEGNTHYGKEAQRATVTAKFVGEQKGDKVQVFKYKSKSGYARRQGHRQLMTLLEISDVKLGAARRTTAKKAAATTAEPATDETSSK
jgi:large subunit ribosomal protein L21